jgi:hypothetical protein
MKEKTRDQETSCGRGDSDKPKPFIMNDMQIAQPCSLFSH